MAKAERKYGPLGRHLGGLTGPASMTFDEIAGLVGGLPPSAYRHVAWWANDPTHVQAHAWLSAGLRVDLVDLDREFVDFAAAPGGSTDATAQQTSPFETRIVEQYPTIGPSLVVHWYIGSVVIEVGGEIDGQWIVADTHVPSRGDGTPTIVRLEQR